MATPEKNFAHTTDVRTKVIVGVVIIVAASVLGGLFYLLMRASGSGPSAPPPLQGAVIRKGSPDYAKYISLIVRDDPEADDAPRLIGDKVMTLKTNVRNFTNKTIDGLEVWAAVVDHKDQPVKETTRVVIPTNRAELGPNQVMRVEISLEGFTDADDRANIKMEVVGFRFKP